MAFKPPIVSTALRSIPISRIPAALEHADPDYDWVHFDVADGVFVPRLSGGPAIVEYAREHSACWFDVHLLVSRPERVVGDFIRAGANLITFHPETTPRPTDLVRSIHEAGAWAGIALGPDTSFERTRFLFAVAEVVLVKTTDLPYEAAFMPESLDRIRQVVAERERAGLPFLVAADGRIALDNVAAVQAAGADIFVFGETLFGTAEPASALATARAALRGNTLAESPDGVTRHDVAGPAANPMTFLNRRRRAR